MAYSRWPGVYFFRSGSGDENPPKFCCMECNLRPQEDGWRGDEWITGWDAAEAHLRAHDPADVDEDAFEELAFDRKQATPTEAPKP